MLTTIKFECEAPFLKSPPLVRQIIFFKKSSHLCHNPGCQSLDGRRQDQRLVLFYKIINGLASVETEDILTPADKEESQLQIQTPPGKL